MVWNSIGFWITARYGEMNIAQGVIDGGLTVIIIRNLCLGYGL